MTMSDFFLKKINDSNPSLIGRLIKDFPYPEKLCPFCNTKLKIINAIHWEEDPYHFKALYLDPNPDCPVYEEHSRKAYARVYYSSQEAYNTFEDVYIPVQRWNQEDLYSYYK
jgi:hypothetical protein